MAITNKEVMIMLKEAKARYIASSKQYGSDSYHAGWFLGACSAFWYANLISYEQYNQLMEINPPSNNSKKVLDNLANIQ